MRINFKKIITLLTLTSLSAVFLIGCRSKEPQQRPEQIELVYYKLFDEEAVFAPIIQDYIAQNPNVKISYRKFVDPVEYENLIINELAEGEGPDIFSVPNTWLDKNFKKVIPADPALISAQSFRDVFVSVAAQDLVRQPPGQEQEFVYGIPLTVDTLALYYNKDHFEDKIPERGKPAVTWEGIKEDVFKLTKQDASFERFEVAGIAMGRHDNITRAIDILYLMLLQQNIDFYDDNGRAIFADNSKSHDALDLFTSFALPANKNYSWNQFLADPNSAEKEIATFARGKVSMAVGYSFMYQQINDNIASLKQKGLDTIDPSAIRVAPIPQLTDPAVSNQKRDTFAHYQVEVVGRNSKHAAEAWKFLRFLASKENITQYSEKTKKPTSRRDMIEEQKDDPIYGVFVDQIGFAESLPILDPNGYNQAFTDAIEAVLATQKPRDAMKVAQEKINSLLSR